MLRRLLCAALLALVAAPAAAADGPATGLGVTYGWDGVAARDGALRYVTVTDGQTTFVQAIRTADGRVVRFGAAAGGFGIPFVAQDGTAGGLSADGKTLVLGDATGGRSLRTVSHFLVYRTAQLQVPHPLVLSGDFSFDALSPGGRLLYLIQHVSSGDLTRYVVRAYDLEHDRLLPRRIADRTQRGWVMQGYPMTRATGADGRFVYTLYQNPGGTPFVHALDTVSATAHCVGVPWRGAPDQAALWNLRLALRDGDRELALRWRSGRPYGSIDARTYRFSYPAARAPWGPLVGGMLGAALLAALGAAALVRRRRRRRFARLEPLGA